MILFFIVMGARMDSSVGKWIQLVWGLILGLHCFDMARADANVQRLSARAADQAEVHPITAESDLPDYVKPLWGVVIDFVVNKPPTLIFDALTQVEKYPVSVPKIKKSKIIQENSDGFVVEYEEGNWGVRESATQKWVINRDDLRIIVSNIGERDRKFWVRTEILPTASPEFSRLKVTQFADTSYIPGVMMNWILNFIGESYAVNHRKMIHDLIELQ